MAFDGHDDRGMTGVVVPLGAVSQGVAQLINPNATPDALAIQLQVVDWRIIVYFGRAIRWIGLTPEEAGKLSADLETAVRYARTLHVPAGD